MSDPIEPMNHIDAMIDALERLRVAEHLINHRLEFPESLVALARESPHISVRERAHYHLDLDLEIAGEIIGNVVAELRAAVDADRQKAQPVEVTR